MTGGDGAGERGGREQFVNGRYRVLRQLGVGGMSTVYLVEDTLDGGRLLALKTVRAGVSPRHGAAAIRQEFRAMSQLRHPNVVEVHDFGRLNEQEDFFTMEAVEGLDLLAATAQAAPEEVASLAEQIARALEHIHAQGLVHFDLKPDNILVGSDGVVKVVDFGLVEELQAIRRGAVKGSVHYLAPEMIRGEPVDHRFDLYSLGAVLFHVLARRPPFEGSTAQVMHDHVHRALDFDGALRRPIPPRWRPLLARLLAKDPAARPGCARGVLIELAELAAVAGSTGGAAVTDGVSQRGSDSGRAPGSRFVGREAELGHLKAAFAQRVEAVVAGAPPLQLVAAPSGMGRSRLVRELRCYVQLRGVRFAHGSAGSTEEGPLSSLREVLRALVREILPPPEGDELSSFRDALRVPWTAAQELAGSLLSHPEGEDPQTMTRVTLAPPPPSPSEEAPARLPPTLVPGEATPRPGQDARSPSSDHGGPPPPISSVGGVLYAARPEPDEEPSDAALAERAAWLHSGLLEVLRPAAPAIARLLPDEPALLALGTAPPPFPTARLEEAWLVRRVATFLVEAARLRPLVLHLSDLHRADPLTLELLGHLARDLAAAGHDENAARDDSALPACASAAAVARRPARLLLVGSYREEEAASSPLLVRAVALWRATGVAELTVLPALDEAEVTRMARSMLGPVRLTAALSRRLVERSGGRPALVEAEVCALLDRGAPRRRGVPSGAWTTRDSGAPPSRSAGSASAR